MWIGKPSEKLSSKAFHDEKLTTRRNVTASLAGSLLINEFAGRDLMKHARAHSSQRHLCSKKDPLNHFLRLALEGFRSNWVNGGVDLLTLETRAQNTDVKFWANNNYFWKNQRIFFLLESKRLPTRMMLICIFVPFHEYNKQFLDDFLTAFESYCITIFRDMTHERHCQKFAFVLNLKDFAPIDRSELWKIYCQRK